jgi:hypothetical protein
MDGKVAATWMWLDAGKLYRLATLRTGVIHEKIKGHKSVSLSGSAKGPGHAAPNAAFDWIDGIGSPFDRPRPHCYV